VYMPILLQGAGNVSRSPSCLSVLLSRLSRDTVCFALLLSLLYNICYFPFCSGKGPSGKLSSYAFCSEFFFYKVAFCDVRILLSSLSTCLAKATLALLYPSATPRLNPRTMPPNESFLILMCVIFDKLTTKST